MYLLYIRLFFRIRSSFPTLSHPCTRTHRIQYPYFSVFAVMNHAVRWPVVTSGESLRGNTEECRERPNGKERERFHTQVNATQMRIYGQHATVTHRQLLVLFVIISLLAIDSLSSVTKRNRCMLLLLQATVPSFLSLLYFMYCNLLVWGR